MVMSVLGIEYHHAFSQTPQRPDRVPPDKKNERDTQTVSVKTKAVVKCYYSWYLSV